MNILMKLKNSKVLSNNEKIIADYILEHPDRILKMTAKDLKEMGIIKKVFFEPEKYTTDTLPKITEKMDKEIVKFLAEKTKITKEQLVDERYNFFSNGY